MHQAFGQEFVDALHGSFLISAIALLVASLLVAFLFQQKQGSSSTSIEPADSQVTTVKG
jgi:hypothetical protein